MIVINTIDNFLYFTYKTSTNLTYYNYEIITINYDAVKNKLTINDKLKQTFTNFLSVVTQISKEKLNDNTKIRINEQPLDMLEKKQYQ